MDSSASGTIISGQKPTANIPQFLYSGIYLFNLDSTQWKQYFKIPISPRRQQEIWGLLPNDVIKLSSSLSRQTPHMNTCTHAHIHTYTHTAVNCNCIWKIMGVSKWLGTCWGWGTKRHKGSLVFGLSTCWCAFTVAGWRTDILVWQYWESLQETQ